MKQKISDMPVRTLFKLGDHVCIKLEEINGSKGLDVHYPLVDLTWGEASFWPDAECEVIGYLAQNGNRIMSADSHILFEHRLSRKDKDFIAEVDRIMKHFEEQIFKSLGIRVQTDEKSDD